MVLKIREPRGHQLALTIVLDGTAGRHRQDLSKSSPVLNALLSAAALETLPVCMSLVSKVRPVKIVYWFSGDLTLTASQDTFYSEILMPGLYRSDECFIGFLCVTGYFNAFVISFI